MDLQSVAAMLGAVGAVLGVIGGILTPIMLTMITLSRKARNEAFAEIKSGLHHLDVCFDKLRLEVAQGYGGLVTREEVETKLGYERNERHKLTSDMQAAILSLADRDELRNLDQRLMTEIRELRRGGK